MPGRDKKAWHALSSSAIGKSLEGNEALDILNNLHARLHESSGHAE